MVSGRTLEEAEANLAPGLPFIGYGAIRSNPGITTDQINWQDVGTVTGIQQLYVIDEIWRDLRRKNPHATGDIRILYSL
jgi:hypothetical protein